MKIFYKILKAGKWGKKNGLKTKTVRLIKGNSRVKD